MTEDEAKTKWCPFARAPLTNVDGSISTGASVVNRRSRGSPDAASLCIGSACMAWRWRTVPNPNWKPASQMSMWPPENPYSATPSGIPSATDGGCGLAGAPQ